MTAFREPRECPEDAAPRMPLFIPRPPVAFPSLAGSRPPTTLESTLVFPPEVLRILNCNPGSPDTPMLEVVAAGLDSSLFGLVVAAGDHMIELPGNPCFLPRPSSSRAVRFEVPGLE